MEEPNAPLCLGFKLMDIGMLVEQMCVLCLYACMYVSMVCACVRGPEIYSAHVACLYIRGLHRQLTSISMRSDGEGVPHMEGLAKEFDGSGNVKKVKALTEEQRQAILKMTHPCQMEPHLRKRENERLRRRMKSGDNLPPGLQEKYAATNTIMGKYWA